MTSTAPLFEKCFAYGEAVRVRESGLYPFFRPIEKNDGTRVVIGGRELLMFGSNNYLGLAQDPRVKEAAVRAIRDYGTSCSGSRFMNGTLDLHEELEDRLAEFTGHEAALCFTTGYQTNLGSISALVGKNDHIISDKLNHASIMDGIFLSRGFDGVNFQRYRHNDPDDLEKVLSRLPEDSGKLVVTDGVFSMEGDIARLPEIKQISEKYGAVVYLDEAHGIGVIGETGRGTVEHHGGGSLTDLVMCTFSKSFGSIGGFVAGNARVIDYIKHFSRPLIFSASMPPANLASVLTTMDIIDSEPERVQSLQANAAYMLEELSGRGFDTGTAETAIIPLVTGDMERTLIYWKALFDRGIYVNPVLPPAVPPNRCLMRTSYMAEHTREELDHFLMVLTEEADRVGIPRNA